MKKIIITILLLAIPSITLAFDVNLRQGSKGEEVKKVQKFLGVEETGYFGNLTKKAVIEFQKQNNLPAFGYWGAITRKVANERGTVAQTNIDTNVVATSTPTEKPYITDWNFKLLTSPNNYYSKSVLLDFTPITSEGTLAKVTRCEYQSELYTTPEGGKHIIPSDGTYKIKFNAIVWQIYTTKVQCVAFTYEKGVYKEYYSPVIEIK